MHSVAQLFYVGSFLVGRSRVIIYSRALESAGCGYVMHVIIFFLCRIALWGYIIPVCDMRLTESLGSLSGFLLDVSDCAEQRVFYLVGDPFVVCYLLPWRLLILRVW